MRAPEFMLEMMRTDLEAQCVNRRFTRYRKARTEVSGKTQFYLVVALPIIRHKMREDGGKRVKRRKLPLRHFESRKPMCISTGNKYMQE